jgi:hypothetical protein
MYNDIVSLTFFSVPIADAKTKVSLKPRLQLKIISSIITNYFLINLEAVKQKSPNAKFYSYLTLKSLQM